MTKKDPDQLGAKETVFRRDAALKLMLSTPHKPHSDSASKRKGKAKKAKPKARGA